MLIIRLTCVTYLLNNEKKEGLSSFFVSTQPKKKMRTNLVGSLLFTTNEHKGNDNEPIGTLSSFTTMQQKTHSKR
jgi:hypothetical protein